MLQEQKLAGLLVSSGCATATVCGADGVCSAYGRVMAWALIGLGLLRLICAVGSGIEVWGMGVVAHAVESSFWWTEYVTVSSARVAVFPSPWKRTTTLLSVVLRPPCTFFHIVLLGPPAITIWLLLSYEDFVVCEGENTVASTLSDADTVRDLRNDQRKKKNRGSFSIFCDFLRLCFRLPRVQGPRRKISRLARTTRELVLVNPVLEGRTQTRIRWRSKGVQRRLGRAPWAGEFINAGKASESDLLPIMEETGCKKRKQAISAAQQEAEKGQRSGEENGGGNGKKPEPPGELWVFNSPEACSPRPSWSWFCRHHLCSALMAFYESLESLNGSSPTRDLHGDHW